MAKKGTPASKRGAKPLRRTARSPQPPDATLRARTTVVENGQPSRPRASREIQIGSWTDFAGEVLSPRYANWAFRGHADANWALQSTLARRFSTAGIDRRAWINQESRILRIFKRKAHLFLDHIPDETDSFRWLALMQHHGAPTRLLDFTWSPYVASFFALENATNDAAIWAVNPPALSLPIALTIGGKLRKFHPGNLGPWIQGNYEKYFLPNEHAFVNYGEPRIMNQRLIAQSGTFIIPSTLALSVDEILNHYVAPEDTIVKFVLKTSRVRETILLELYRMNITHYTLFPGLDGLARSMGYEAEYSWSFDPRTMRPRPGYEKW